MTTIWALFIVFSLQGTTEYHGQFETRTECWEAARQLSPLKDETVINYCIPAEVNNS